MNEFQIAALRRLHLALKDANDAGLLDVLQRSCSNHASINDVCDAVGFEIKALEKKTDG